MKKQIFISLFSLIFFQAIYAHSISAGAGMPYYKDDFSVQDFFINSQIDINKNSSLEYRLKWFRFNNIQISTDYSLDKLDLLVHTLNYEYTFSNPYVKAVGANINFLNSFSGEGYLSSSSITLDSNPDFNKTFGGGFYTEFGRNIRLCGELFYSVPSLVFESDEVKGFGYVGLLDLSKGFDFNNSSLKFHAGTLYGTGECNDNLDPAISGMTVNYDIIADASLFSIFGFADYELNYKNFSASIFSGLAYIPVMNYSYEIVRHLKLAKTWYKKIMNQEQGNSLENYLFIPFVFDSSYKIKKAKYTVIPEFEKAFIIPLNLKENTQSNSSSMDMNSLTKTLLLSGLSLKISVFF